jgi:hypothetical protein
MMAAAALLKGNPRLHSPTAQHTFDMIL